MKNFRILSYFLGLLLAAGLYAGICFAADSAAAGMAQEAYQEALRLREAGNFDEAEHQFRIALSMAPSNAEYHFELSNLYAIRFDISRKRSKKMADYSMLVRAAQELEQALMFKPDFLAARYNLGIVYKRQEQYEKAREEFRRVLQLDPKQAMAMMQVGATYEEQGFYDEAKTFYEKALELDYGNQSIRSALEELKKHQAEDAERGSDSRRSMMGGMMGSDFRHTPNSQASSFQSSQSSDPGSASSGIQQAIPYLGQMLLQKFSNSRNDDGNEGSDR